MYQETMHMTLACSKGYLYVLSLAFYKKMKYDTKANNIADINVWSASYARSNEGLPQFTWIYPRNAIRILLMSLHLL